LKLEFWAYQIIALQRVPATATATFANACIGAIGVLQYMHATQLISDTRVRSSISITTDSMDYTRTGSSEQIGFWATIFKKGSPYAIGP